MDARTQARQAGLIVFNGQPCRACGQPRRYVSSGRCVSCISARSRRYRSKHPTPDLRAYSAAYAKLHVDKIRARQARYYKLNAERLRAAGAKYRKENASKVRAANAKWTKSHPEKQRAYRAKWESQSQNRNKIHIIGAKRRAAKIHATPAYADLDAIRQIYLNCPEGYEVDHVIPLRGKLVSGFHIETNLQYLTRSENYSKRHNFEPIFTNTNP